MLNPEVGMRRFLCLMVLGAAAFSLATPASADVFFFTTGSPDGRLGTASRPESPGKIEIESADDFVLTNQTLISRATFIGLLPAGFPLTSIGEVKVEIYRVFPKDSDTNRIPQVPTRANSPSDVEFDSRSKNEGTLKLTASVLNPNFMVADSLINNIKVGGPGEGPRTGQEVLFDVTFTDPFDLPADHYFFVPQVELPGTGDFLWLSAPHPQFTGDLQEWIRNANLDPDWLRVGTDIIGGTTFNGTFSLFGEQIIPEPGTFLLLGLGIGGLFGYAWVRRKLPA
jgi:hypothetical protein